MNVTGEYHGTENILHLTCKLVKIITIKNTRQARLVRLQNEIEITFQPLLSDEVGLFLMDTNIRS